MTINHYNPLLCRTRWIIYDYNMAPRGEINYEKPVSATVALASVKEKFIARFGISVGPAERVYEYCEALHNQQNAISRRMVADSVNTPRN